MTEFEKNFIAEELRLRKQLDEFWEGEKGKECKEEIQRLYGDSFDIFDFLNIKKQKDE